MRVALLGGFGTGNLGNDASLEAVIRMIRRCAPDALIICYCPNPQVIHSQFGIEAHAIRARRPASQHTGSVSARLLRMPYRFADILRAIRLTSVDVLLVPGTGILDDYGGERPSGWPLTLAVWLGAARARGARTGLVSVGAGPMAHPISRRLARMAAGLVDYRSFRDHGSRNFAVSLGLSVPVAEVVPDIVFSLPTPLPTPTMSDRPVVAVPVMRYRGWEAVGRSAVTIEDQHVQNVSDFCVWLLEQRYAVRIITAGASDAEATRRVAERVEAATPELAERWLTAASADTLHELMQLVADATAVVATRYHSVIGALLCGKPTISISYAAKNDELMAEVGLGAYCQHVEQVDPALLRSQFTRLIGDHSCISAEVSKGVATFRDQLAAEEERLRSFVLGRLGGYALERRAAD